MAGGETWGEGRGGGGAGAPDGLSFSAEGGGLSNASIRLQVIAVKIFFRWLAIRKFIPKDVAEGLQAPRLDASLPETLTETEVEHLLASIEPKEPL